MDLNISFVFLFHEWEHFLVVVKVISEVQVMLQVEVGFA